MIPTTGLLYEESLFLAEAEGNDDAPVGLGAQRKETPRVVAANILYLW
uniref:Uncharacterized protein n=1 Tax=Physcomitrium patens TaxID=3218 RepID=A0A2K1K673_PHYPA|nr:hypothetical protein PHYPA_011172 [Physcomitrium patens]